MQNTTNPSILERIFGESKHLLDQEFFGNSLEHIIWAAVIFVVLATVFHIFRSVILHRLRAFAESTATGFDDQVVIAVEKIHPRFYDLVALYLASQYLSFSEGTDKMILAIFTTLVTVQAILAVQNFVNYLLLKIVSKESKEDVDPTAINGLSLFVKITLWITGLLLILSNLGFNITSLAASLGIGGIAIALAVQNILGDIFSSFSIYFDKPFVIGDFIIVGTDMGTVRKIGMKSTRIETLQGEELVISNKELTEARIQNFKKMQKRRVVYSLGVTYDTPVEKMKQIPDIIRGIYKEFEERNEAQLDRVDFFKFGDFSLNYEIVYYHLSGDYTAYARIRGEINYRLLDEFNKAGISFAFPTQTVHVEKV